MRFTNVEIGPPIECIWHEEELQFSSARFYDPLKPSMICGGPGF